MVLARSLEWRRRIWTVEDPGALERDLVVPDMGVIMGKNEERT